MREGSKFFVDRKGETTAEKLARFARAEPLFGTGARAEEDGTILIQRWREEKRGTIRPDDYASLSKRQRPDTVIMRKGLKSKAVRSREVMEFESVEDTLRSVDYILEGQKREQKQAEVVRNRTRFLLDYFREHEISRIPEEQRLVYQQETIGMLSEVGLDPESVKLEVKLLMILWTVKGSSGKDSLGRDNELIALQDLEAAQRRARRREMVVRGNITLKYSQIGGGLLVARAAAREAMFEVGDEVDRRLLPNVYFDDPDTPIWKDINYTVDKIDNLSWLLDGVLVKPYRPVALLGKGYLEQAKGLLEERSREAIHALHDRGLVQGMRQSMSLDPEVGLLGRTLAENAHVYPENSS